MTKVNISLEIDDYIYQLIITGCKLLNNELTEKYKRNIVVKQETFIRYALEDYIQSIKQKPTFNEN